MMRSQSELRGHAGLISTRKGSMERPTVQLEALVIMTEMTKGYGSFGIVVEVLYTLP